ncbi:glutamine synthetase [Haloimpatiens lingqiaonensis]|uniref:glutamine synthetase n=1 Tax=Haloimpatiens lingqiaonensis TaxID=1380675 RepID=UPI0010FF34B3|nr:glutamine synthetase [Haloimpatiens lingqiaonensis]
MNDLLYTISKENHSPKALKDILSNAPEVKFVSFVGVDLAGNDTDEKIPISLFLKDIEGFLTGAIQTDGSSVALPGIATINNAKIDMIADKDSTWFIDYNYEHLDSKSGRPIGTLRIPCFLYHDSKAVDSRSILKNAIHFFKTSLMNMFRETPELLHTYNIEFDDIEDISVTAATELEFWVQTPNDEAHVEELSTSQVLQEQYWTRTKGSVRTSLEQCLMLMEAYGFNPEMGHKEVGGVKAKVNESGSYTHIMEQLEIDWKYSNAIQTSDNEIIIKNIVRETFRLNGLDVTFLAKPIDSVAGSGKHTHISITLNCKSGKCINLFTATKDHFLSAIGYASIMGILKNYEVISPFVSPTYNSLKRLKPGFEAPVCVVTSLGHTVEMPSRNRTILLALIRDLDNPFSTRFELRSPNPHTNTYLCIASMCMAMLDGISYAIKESKTEDDLLKELSKNYGEEFGYLEKYRMYRSEDDVFHKYSEKDRDKFFGKAPKTVQENLSFLDNCKDKVAILKKGNVFTDTIINGFKSTSIKRWLMEINHRIINNYMKEVRGYKKLHLDDLALDLDLSYWIKINDLRKYIMKDTYDRKSLFTQIKEASKNEDLPLISELQLELDNKMEELRKLYCTYEKNLLDI